MKDHCLVMQQEHIDYSDLTKFGTLEITNHPERGIEIYVTGFEFSGDESCRQYAAKVMAWARDLLDTSVRAQLLVPGGPSQITVGVD